MCSPPSWAIGIEARATGDAAPRPLDGLCALLKETARRRLDALARQLRRRLVPSEEPPAAAVAERIVQMDAAELQLLQLRLRERLAQAAAEG